MDLLYIPEREYVMPFEALTRMHVYDEHLILYSLHSPKYQAVQPIVEFSAVKQRGLLPMQCGTKFRKHNISNLDFKLKYVYIHSINYYAHYIKL